MAEKGNIALVPFSAMNYLLFLYCINQKVDQHYFHDYFFSFLMSDEQTLLQESQQ